MLVKEKLSRRQELKNISRSLIDLVRNGKINRRSKVESINMRSSWRMLKRYRIVMIFALSLFLALIIIKNSTGELSYSSTNMVKRVTVNRKYARLRNVESILENEDNNVNNLFDLHVAPFDKEATNSHESTIHFNKLKTLSRPTYKRQMISTYHKATSINLTSNKNGTANTVKNHDGTKLESREVSRVLQEFEGVHEIRLKDIAQIKVPNTVYFVWCPNRTIEFRHFLGILSIWKIMRPNIIEFNHQYPIVQDDYNNWIQELKEMIPEFVTVQFASIYDRGDENRCAFWVGLAHVQGRGGMYIANDIIVTEGILQYLGNPFSALYRTRYKQGLPEAVIVMGIAKEESVVNFRKTYYDGRTVTGREIMCSELNMKYEFMTPGPCQVIIKPSFHPEDLWSLSTNFGAFARRLLYGSSNVVTPKPHLPGNIPKIIHYIWFGKRKMTFIMYLSMLSSLFIANPDMIYIHGDGGLYGTYFDKIRKDTRVAMIPHQQPLYIYGHRIIHVQHFSDILRAEILLRYGGIYVDWDVVWLRDPQNIINAGYDAVANFDHMPKPNFPDTINLGVFMAKPKSVFVKRWQDAFKTYRSKDFLYNAVLLPYKIYEKYPEHLYIERRLQVMCYYLMCHPAFHQDFKNYNEEQPFSWREDVYSMHFTWPDPAEWSSEETCNNSTGRFAEIGKYILQHQEKLPKFP